MNIGYNYSNSSKTNKKTNKLLVIKYFESKTKIIRKVVQK